MRNFLGTFGFGIVLSISPLILSACQGTAIQQPIVYSFKHSPSLAFFKTYDVETSAQPAFIAEGVIFTGIARRHQDNSYDVGASFYSEIEGKRLTVTSARLSSVALSKSVKLNQNIQMTRPETRGPKPLFFEHVFAFRGIEGTQIPLDAESFTLHLKYKIDDTVGTVDLTFDNRSFFGSVL
jgi:hypothetical protein